MVMSERLKARLTVYQFLVRLRGFTPAIWRRLRLTDCKLQAMHEAIQLAFGFSGGLPFEFLPHDFATEETGSARRPISANLWLSKLVPLDGADFELMYTAGRGDAWRCRVSFEDLILSSSEALYPFCVEGERAGVPDRQMGPRAFRRFLKAWTVPNCWEADSHQTSISYDPSEIDLAGINANLQPTARPAVHFYQREPLMRISLEAEEWVHFWDCAAVDEDERERMICEVPRDAVWLYLPEAVQTARHLIMAAHETESDETRDLLDRLVGRLYRKLALHGLRHGRLRSVSHDGIPCPVKAESDLLHVHRE